MIKYIKRWGEKLKKYENRHPILIILWSVCVTLLVVLFSGGVYLYAQQRQEIRHVWFEDKEFEKAVQKSLEKKYITADDLKNLTTLEIEDNKQIEDISDLVKFPNLTSLVIKNCEISDLHVIGKLDKLKSLNLMGNNIEDLTPLSECYALKEIFLGNNNITDITPLYNLNGLQTVGLQQNNISSIEPGIEKMVSLSYIDIANNRIISIDPLGDIENLVYLYAGSNKLSETPQLSDMSALKVLDLSNNAFQKLDKMGDFPSLQELNIYRNHLESLEVLEGCPNLMKLNLSYNDFHSLDGILQCEKLEYLDIRSTEIEDVKMLKELPEFNSIYMDEGVDRSQLDFMIGHFRNGDIKTKQYLLQKQYSL